MSADLYSSEIDEKQSGSLLIDMQSSGLLQLTIFGKSNEDFQMFLLPPNEEGWKEAINLINALKEWVRHTKESKLNEIWEDNLTSRSNK